MDVQLRHGGPERSEEGFDTEVEGVWLAVEVKDFRSL